MTSTVRAAIRIRGQYGQRRLPPCDPVVRARWQDDRFADGRKIERAPQRADDLGGALLLEIEADARLADRCHRAEPQRFEPPGGTQTPIKALTKSERSPTIRAKWRRPAGKRGQEWRPGRRSQLG
jgi:hypothetical protein